MSEAGRPVPVRLAPRPFLTESAVGTPPPAPAPGDEQVALTIDGREISAAKGQLIIDVADDAGIYIPRFCYHPRMKPVGMCRMCLVEVSTPRGPTLIPACYNAVADGMAVSTASPMARKAQDGVIEFLLVNHPLDCPVCDKGGECPLQDQTLAYGPGESRFVEEKRHWDKPTPISELVYIDRERCIQCGRCVRFADEVAGDPLIDFYERGDQTEVATFADSNPFSSYFSGNIVQICPVGALTATPYRFKARPWDLGQVESSCTSCSLGCRMAVQASSDELVRYLGVDNDPVNWSWLCDKGRFGYEAVNSDQRLHTPLVRRGDQLVEVSWAEALAAAAAGLDQARQAGTGLAVVGGSRLPNEDAYAWSKLARVVLGTDNIDAQLGDGLPATAILGFPRATIDQAAAAPLVITVGPDLKEELPILYLRLRHAAREEGLQIVELTPTNTGLTPYAALTLRYRPGELATLAAAIAGGTPAEGTAGGTPAEGTAGGTPAEGTAVSAEDIDAARAHIERARAEAPDGQPAVVLILGRPSLAEPAEAAVAAAAALTGPGVAVLSALRRSNVHGALDMGLAPGVLPGRVALADGREWYEQAWGTELPKEPGLDTAGILDHASRGHIGALVLLGADPVSDFPDQRAAIRGLDGARFVVAVDTFLTPSSRRADVVLPAATFAERRGTFTNVEGRISHLGSIVTAPGVAWPDWTIASELAWRLGTDLGFGGLEEIWAEIATVSPLHRGVTYGRLTAAAGSDGVVVPLTDGAVPTRRPRSLDPMADPGIVSAEVHTIPPTAIAVAEPHAPADPAATGAVDAVVDLAAAPAEPASSEAASSDDRPADAGPSEDAAAEAATAEAATAEAAATLSPPPMLQPIPAATVTPAPAPAGAGDGLALVAGRSLWDAGTQVARSPALAGLHPAWAAGVHPDQLAELGVADGAAVRLRTSRGSVEAPVRADPAVPKGSVRVPFNLPGGSASELIDAKAPTVRVRIEPVEEGGA